VNGLHPFVGAFYDEFTSKTSGLPLEEFAMAEVLLESHLYQAGLKQDQLDAVMSTRDQLLRYVAFYSVKILQVTKNKISPSCGLRRKGHAAAIVFHPASFPLDELLGSALHSLKCSAISA
jgi:hypothetical protein